MSTNGSILSIEGLNRRFGEREVVRSLDLALARGERMALQGANGSGKTTVLRCVAGTLTPTSGRVEVGGHPAGALEARRLIGASLSQERSFYLRLTGHANLLFFARLRYGSERESAARVGALEEELEIADIGRQRVDRCSSGMIQQLAIARALLGEPRLLLLDEPTRSLDVEARARLWGALDRRRDTAVLFATHLDEDLEHCDLRLSLPA
ncbi:MAG TPA: ABC transporter ATP-binding protein [Gaiellaceae bacterium]|jgi:ABC-type multidrug transport system ATPase subunit